jgi:hypothetical protein
MRRAQPNPGTANLPMARKILLDHFSLQLSPNRLDSLSAEPKDG